MFNLFIDYATDTIIQNSLRHELNSDVTLITVAHRLQTIMDSDKIVSNPQLNLETREPRSELLPQLVLDAGELKEFDSPQSLLRKETGFFKSLVDGSGDRDALYRIAQAKESR